jgi:hypothetical protein
MQPAALPPLLMVLLALSLYAISLTTDENRAAQWRAL